MIDPDKDGIDHINIYTKGKTELGRLLTNLADTPFTHEDYGHFKSVEGLWYWLISGKTQDEFKNMSGFEAKKMGKLIPEENKCPVDDDFKEAIKKGFKAKVRENKKIIKLLYESTLPFEHYYFYGKNGNYKVMEMERHKWQCEEFERLRTIIKDFYNNKKNTPAPPKHKI